VVFFSVIGQYWPASVYGMPWRMTDQLVREATALQRQHGAARVLVPQHDQELNVLYRVLTQHGANAAEFDDRSILVLPGQPALYLAVGEGRAQAYLAASFAPYLLREERLPGYGTPARFYLLPAETAAAPLPRGATPLGWTLGTGGAALARLDGVALPRRAAPGQAVEVTTFTSALAQPGTGVPDFSIFAHFIGSDGRAVAQQDAPAWPSRYWRPGDRVVQWLDLAIPTDASPGLLLASLGMYSTGTPDRPAVHPLVLRDGEGHELGASATGPALALPPPPPGLPAHPLGVSFAGGIGLEGYDLARAGGALTVTLHWVATAAVPPDYTVFVHLLDASGRLVAQHDGQPAGGQFPTSFWRPGDRLADAHALSLPAALPAGTYRLEFGLYELPALRRLAVTSGRAELELVLPARR
jgi:hypothetical protein